MGGKNEVIFAINIYLIIQTVTRLTELVSPFHYVIFFLAVQWGEEMQDYYCTNQLLSPICTSAEEGEKFRLNT